MEIEFHKADYKNVINKARAANMFIPYFIQSSESLHST